jgi:SagB-type dehydrogenase family enzyme
MEKLMVLERVQRLLNGPSSRTVVLDGLHEAAGRVRLPEPSAELPGRLADVLHSRRSSYRFATAAPTALELSTVLRWALGPQRTVRLPDGAEHAMRMAPSAGGLPSLATFVASRPGGEIPGGVHRVEGGTLTALWSGDPRAALASVLAQPEFADRAPLVLVLVARLDTTLTKYPVRHYRTLHVDAGIAVQNLYLVAAALGLNCCAVTGFDDGGVAGLLRLPDTMFPVVLFPLGGRP